MVSTFYESRVERATVNLMLQLFFSESMPRQEATAS